MKHSEAREFLKAIVLHNIECAEKGKSINDYVIPFFVGDPGVGKTAIPKQVSREIGIPYFQTIVAQYDAGEMAGLPYVGEKVIEDEDDNGNVVHHTHKEMVRLRPSYLPDIRDPNERVGVYNLDEMPQAFLANQNICSQLVNEYAIGKHAISRGISICATGNKPENKAGTTTMPMHLRDRLCFCPIEPDTEEYLTYAAENGVDGRIRAYLRNNPGKLHKFEVGQDANPTPRSWDKTSAILSMNLSSHIRTSAITGQIGLGIGSEFEAWLRVEDKMPKLTDVIRDPMGAPVFDARQADVLYMLLTALADATTVKNLDNILQYIKRLPNQEWSAVWYKDAISRDKSLNDTKAMTKWKLTDGAKITL